MTSNITSLYAGILGLFFIYLSVHVIKTRLKENIIIGTDENPNMVRACRAHSNFIEYTPIFLFLLFLSESNGATSLFLHLSGASFIFGRMFHLYSITVDEVKNKKHNFRQIGMIITFTNIAINSVYLIFRFFN